MSISSISSRVRILLAALVIAFAGVLSGHILAQEGVSGAVVQIDVSTFAGRSDSSNNESGSGSGGGIVCSKTTSGPVGGTKCRFADESPFVAIAAGQASRNALDVRTEARVNSDAWSSSAFATSEIFDVITVDSDSNSGDTFLVEVDFTLIKHSLDASGDGGSAEFSAWLTTLNDSNQDGVLGPGDDSARATLPSLFPGLADWVTPERNSISIPGNGISSQTEFHGNAAFGATEGEPLLWNLVMTASANGFGQGDSGETAWAILIDNLHVSSLGSGQTIDDATILSDADIDYPVNRPDADPALPGGGFLEGDFNRDNVLDSADIDLLSLSVGTNFAHFDLNGDGVIEESDRVRWVEELRGTHFGDSNFDLAVNFDDFLSMSQHFGQEGGWERGDFDGSGVINFADFLLFSENFGQSNSQNVSAVPEPSSMALCFSCLLACSAVLRTKRTQLV